jgi:hypothetical protein
MGRKEWISTLVVSYNLGKVDDRSQIHNKHPDRTEIHLK